MSYISDDRRGYDSFVAKRDVELNDLTLQEGETVDAKWVTLEELDEMHDKGYMASPVMERLEPLRASFEKVLGGKH